MLYASEEKISANLCRLWIPSSVDSLVEDAVYTV